MSLAWPADTPGRVFETGGQTRRFPYWRALKTNDRVEMRANSCDPGETLAIIVDAVQGVLHHLKREFCALRLHLIDQLARLSPRIVERFRSFFDPSHSPIRQYVAD